MGAAGLEALYVSLLNTLHAGDQMVPPQGPFTLSRGRSALSFRPVNCALATDFMFRVLSVFLDATRLGFASGLRSIFHYRPHPGVLVEATLKMLTEAEMAMLEMVDVARLVGDL